MAIRQKASAGDMDLLEILEDPVWFSEFMRMTRDGSPNKETWLPDFKYRPYQKDLITDQHKYLVLTGGRSVGKCQPIKAKILTVDGYESIYSLRNKKYFEVYCFDDNGNLTTRRAVLIKDAYVNTYTVTTSSGNTTYATMNHPFLTRDGYTELENLSMGDEVVVMKRLPHKGNNNFWRKNELKYFGYRFFHGTWRPGVPFKPRFTQIKNDYINLAKEENCTPVIEGDTVRIVRSARWLGKNPFNHILNQLVPGSYRYHTSGVQKSDSYINYVPKSLMAENLDNIRIFITSVIAQYAELSSKKVVLECTHYRVAEQIAEILLKFGVETRKIEGSNGLSKLETSNYRSVYELYKLGIPGVKAEIDMPDEDDVGYTKYERIKSIEYKSKEPTYDLHVYDFHNYIADNFVVHNSVVLEDSMLFKTLNQDVLFPQTKEMLLTTNNMAQLEPLLGRVRDRLTGSHLLKEFVKSTNQTAGVYNLMFRDVPFKLRARIAGGERENSIVGLHLPDIIIDEGQLYMEGAYRQLTPVLNTWEDRYQMFIAGVPNGLRNSSLYITSVKTPHFKWYRVPSPNNPYFTLDDYMRALREHGGENSDGFKQMVLGKHGSSALAVISRDQMTKSAYEFYNYSFNGAMLRDGIHWKTRLDLPDLKAKTFVIGMDCGFVDPSVISILGLTDGGRWRYMARYKLFRVDYTDQEQILHWLQQKYNFASIAIDYGGGGIQVAQSLINRPQYVSQRYDQIILPVMFGERIVMGYSTEGKDLKVTTKSLGARLLVQGLQDSTIELSEMDHEGISELERITKQKDSLGNDKYYILSERGTGASQKDHIFASLICFSIAIRDTSLLRTKRKKLGRSGGKF